MPWNPQQYEKFQDERSAPFRDLLTLVKRRDKLSVIDLGCGTGELTRQLADSLPDSDVLGIDSSLEMLTRAESFVRPGLRFALKTIENVNDHYDLIFSNAAIHWVSDHPQLIPRLVGMLNPGGQLAIQLPSNHKHYSHIAILETASEAPFESALNGWKRNVPVLNIEEYADLLYASDMEDITIFEKIYPHVLKDADAIVEWISGTALVPYLERLPKDLSALFTERCREKIRAHWPNSPVFYGFRRILFAASRPTK